MNKKTKKISLITLVLLALIVVTVGFIFISNALSKKVYASTYNESLSVEKSNVVTSDVKSLSTKPVAVNDEDDNEVYVAFSFAGGTGGTKKVFATYGEDMPTLGLKAPSKENYIFLGYFDDDNNSKQYYDANMNSTSICDVEDILILTAHWKGKEVIISLDHNGGTNSTASLNVNFGEDIGRVTIPTKEGCTFLGYYTDDDKQVYAKDGYPTTGYSKCTFTEDVTLTAKWYSAEYDIIYTITNPEIGFWSPRDEANPENYPEKYSYYDCIILEPVVRGRYELTFNPDFIYLDTGDKYITCTWALKSADITYVLNGGINNPENPRALAASEVFVLKNPKRVGYEFSGWYLNDTKVTSITNNTGADITLTAKWEERLSNARLVKPSASETSYTLPNATKAVSVELPDAGFYNPCIIDIPKEVTKVQFFSINSKFEYYVCIRARARTLDLDIYLDNVRLRSPLSTDVNSSFPDYCIYSPCADVITNLYTYNDVLIYGRTGLDGNSTKANGEDGGSAILCANLVVHRADNLVIQGGNGGTAYYNSNGTNGNGGIAVQIYQSYEVKSFVNVYIAGGYDGNHNTHADGIKVIGPPPIVLPPYGNTP